MLKRINKVIKKKLLANKCKILYANWISLFISVFILYHYIYFYCVLVLFIIIIIIYLYIFFLSKSFSLSKKPGHKMLSLVINI